LIGGKGKGGFDMKKINLEVEGKVKLLLNYNYFAPFILGMTINRSDELYRSMGSPAHTDGKSITVSPAFFEEKCSSVDEASFVYVHETYHNIFLHPFRLKNIPEADWTLYKMAADFVINSLCKEQGFDVKTCANPSVANCRAQKCEHYLYDPQFKGMTTEEVLAILKKDPNMQPQGGGGKGKCPNCFDKASGNEAEQQKAIQDIVAKTKTASELARKMGKGLAGIEGQIAAETLHIPHITDMLNQFVTVSKRSGELSWTRPNRRYLSQGIVMPSLHEESFGKIGVIVDSSGSVAHKIAEFLGHINGIIEDIKPSEVVMLVGGDKVDHRFEYSQEDFPIPSHQVWYGGGTDFRPLLAAMEEEAPECVIYLTDMEGSFPEIPPNYPILWASIYKDSVAPFGLICYV
jgi:predicted metal-dependent peptidase